MVTLKIRTPRGSMHLGNNNFEYNVPRAVEFTAEEAKKIERDKKSVEHFFDMEDFDGEIQKEEAAKLTEAPEVLATTSDDAELKEIIEGGNVGTLLAFIENKGYYSIPEKTLRDICESLDIKVRKNATPEKMISALKEYAVSALKEYAEGKV